MPTDTGWRRYTPAFATAAALLAIALGALWLIAPVWQPGYRPAGQNASLPAERETLPGEEAPLDVNTATAQELTVLPGIGAAKAQAIVEYRAAHGPFAALEDLAQVEGISARMVEEWRGLATAGAAQP